MLHKDDKPLEEVIQENEPVEQSKEEQTPPVTETANDTDAEEMELLADLRKSTDKDVDKTTQQSANSTGQSNPAQTTTVVTDPTKPRTNITYQNHELVAKLTVAALNIAMGMILQLIADDWTEEAERKYSLSTTRKAEFLEPLTLVLEQSKSKYNPVVILVITVLVAYVPMFINAFRTRKEKNRLAKLKKQGVKKAIESAEEVEEEKETVKEQIEAVSVEKKNAKKEAVRTEVKTVEIFKMTKAQQDKLKAIKAKKGRRSADEDNFLKEMGLYGLI